MKIENLLKELKFSLLIIIPLLLILYFTSKDLLFSILICLFLAIIVSIQMTLESYLSYKRHLKIIESEAFKKLISEGFIIENVNKYSGINGTYRNYIFDIYYNWLSITFRKNKRALVLNIYFEMPKLYDNKINHKLIEKISERYIPSRWKLNKYVLVWREGNIMMNNPIGFKNPKYEFIKERMDILIGILQKENIFPIQKDAILQNRKENKFHNIPEIEVYYNE